MNSNHIDQTLRTFYSNLLQTRKQLEELKRNINQTLKELKSLDFLLKQEQIKITNFTIQSRSQHIHPLKEWTNQIQCKKCQKQFSGPNEMFQHQKSEHSRCIFCKSFYFESKSEHEKFLCPQIRMHCDTCGLEIERKMIDRHVKVCSFRRCHKCHDKVYLKAYAYHLQNCNETLVGNNKIKKEFANKENVPSSINKKQLSLLPCSVKI